MTLDSTTLAKIYDDMFYCFYSEEEQVIFTNKYMEDKDEQCAQML